MEESDRIIFLPGAIAKHFQTVYRVQNPGQPWVTVMLLQGYEPELQAFSSMDKLCQGLQKDPFDVFWEFSSIGRYMANPRIFNPEEARFFITGPEISSMLELNLEPDLGVEETNSLVFYNPKITPKLDPGDRIRPILAFASATEAKAFIKCYNSNGAERMKQLVEQHVI